MKKKYFFFTLWVLTGLGMSQSFAQTASTSDFLIPQQPADRTVPFKLSDPGVATPIIWGLDLAWLDESNIRRGIAFMGNDHIDIIRSSFTPTAPLIDGELPETELSRLNRRLNIIDLLGRPTNLSLNCDHPSVDKYFFGNPENWAKLIDVTARHHEERGHTIVTVAPFNEPDYTYTGQGTVEDFYAIAGLLKQNPRFANTRISGGNTLNNDQALKWYNNLKDRLDEGNTHQLAGSFDTYAAFFTAVRANGHHATNDELHNIMEAMVGVEYGMQTGIWWGTADYARGEFVKASRGERLAYAEHRPNWSAASVYRTPQGKIQAFGGMSERQATTTSYRFFSKERDVYFDGHGPLREFTLEMPGGNGYQINQPNAERVINITWGEDIQPVINGRYVLVNRQTRRVMDTDGSSKSSGANIQQNSFNRGVSQRWDVTPVDPRNGGDFSCYSIVSANSQKSLDVLNFSLSDGGNIIQYDLAPKSHNQQWFLEYAEDGWFYIRSRHSAKCLEVANGSSAIGANIHQGEKTGSAHQQWRFLPVGAAFDFIAPSAPTELKATSQARSVRLEWTASPESDVAGYILFRADSEEGEYNTIARNVTSTSFVDNTVVPGETYFYAVKAIDQSLNRSDYSAQTSGMATGEKGLVMNLSFEGNTHDNTPHLNHGAVYGEASYVEGKVGAKALEMDGKESFLQLSTNVANLTELTFAAWVYRRGSEINQRIFDFGNGEEESMYLLASSSGGQIRFIMKKGEQEEYLVIPLASSFNIRNKWGHVAVTISETEVRMYMDGELVSESNSFTIKPKDIQPVLNYIGRSQSSQDPLFNGLLDDVRLYDYAHSASEIAKIAEIPSGITGVESDEKELVIWPVPAKDILHISYAKSTDVATVEVYNIEGSLIMNETMQGQKELNVSGLAPGMYFLKWTNGEKSYTKKFIIKQ